MDLNLSLAFSDVLRNENNFSDNKNLVSEKKKKKTVKKKKNSWALYPKGAVMLMPSYSK